MNKLTALPLPLLVLLQLLLLAAASPIRYDQRQEGDSNVDARLQNFFVVLAPSNMGQLGGSALFDLASKAVPLRLRPQAGGDGPKQREEVDDNAEQAPGQGVKEVKSGRAVNVVPIPAAILQSPLAKLHPEVQAINVQEVLIAQSPVVALKSPTPGLVPAAAAAAVPMLVAVPVPEVAPERPAAPPGLLPMNPTAGLRAPAPAPAEPAQVETSPAAPEVAPEVIPEAAPELTVVAVAAPAADAQEPAAPAVETNQVEPEPAKEAEVLAPKVHLIGTGIEECGPERARNAEGVCVDAVERD